MRLLNYINILTIILSSTTTISMDQLSIKRSEYNQKILTVAFNDRKKFEDTVRQAVAEGIHPDALTTGGNDKFFNFPTPLAWVIFRDTDNTQFVQFLLEYKANPNIEVICASVKQPLLFLAKTTKILTLLLKSGANVHAKNETGETALCHFASPNHIPDKDERLQCITLLIEYGIDPTIVDKHGHTPLSIICSNNRNDSDSIAEYLVENFVPLYPTSKSSRSFDGLTSLAILEKNSQTSSTAQQSAQQIGQAILCGYEKRPNTIDTFKKRLHDITRLPKELALIATRYCMSSSEKDEIEYQKYLPIFRPINDENKIQQKDLPQTEQKKLLEPKKRTKKSNMKKQRQPLGICQDCVVM